MSSIFSSLRYLFTGARTSNDTAGTSSPVSVDALLIDQDAARVLATPMLKQLKRETPRFDITMITDHLDPCDLVVDLSGTINDDTLRQTISGHMAVQARSNFLAGANAIHDQYRHNGLDAQAYTEAHEDFTALVMTLLHRIIRPSSIHAILTPNTFRIRVHGVLAGLPVTVFRIKGQLTGYLCQRCEVTPTAVVTPVGSQAKAAQSTVVCLDRKHCGAGYSVVNPPSSSHQSKGH